MTFGGSLFLIAAGAILRYAVSDRIDDVNLEVVGLILMIVGIAGLILAMWQTRRVTSAADRDGLRSRW